MSTDTKTGMGTDTSTGTSTTASTASTARPEAAAPARLIVLWEKPSDPEAFEQHYREVHIPLARKIPGLLSYMITRDVTAVRGEPYYIVAELAWENLDELRTAFASPEGQATAADVEKLHHYAAIRSMIVSGGVDVA